MQNLVAGTRSLSSSCSYTPTPSCFFSTSSSSGSSCTCLTKWAPASDGESSVVSTSRTPQQHPTRSSSVVVSAFFGLGGSKGSSAKAAGKGCFSCGGKGAIECQGCKGTGKDKKNGNVFERWKCYECQGFGLVGCPKCGTGGLTPEQRGER